MQVNFSLFRKKSRHKKSAKKSTKSSTLCKKNHNLWLKKNLFLNKNLPKLRKWNLKKWNNPWLLPKNHCSLRILSQEWPVIFSRPRNNPDKKTLPICKKYAIMKQSVKFWPNLPHNKNPNLLSICLRANKSYSFSIKMSGQPNLDRLLIHYQTLWTVKQDWPYLQKWDSIKTIWKNIMVFMLLSKP